MRVLEERVDQLLLVGEAAVDGADADARVMGDVVQGDVEAALGEHLARPPRGCAGGCARRPCGGAARRGVRHEVTWPQHSEQSGGHLSISVLRSAEKLRCALHLFVHRPSDKAPIMPSPTRHPSTPALADPRRPRHRPADGRARRDHREHRAALRPAGAAASPTRPAVGGHRLRARLRQPAAARRPDRRPVRPQADVRRRPGRLRRSPPRSAAPPQSFGMLVAARALQGVFGALLAPAALSLLTTTFTDPQGARQGVRHLRRDRRRRRRDRPDARRRADRVPRPGAGASTSTSPSRSPPRSARSRCSHDAPRRRTPRSSTSRASLTRLGRPVRARLRLLARRDRRLERRR